MIQMNEINKIRKAYFVDKISINLIAYNFKRSWEMINRIVRSPREEFKGRGKKYTKSR